MDFGSVREGTESPLSSPVSPSPLSSSYLFLPCTIGIWRWKLYLLGCVSSLLKLSFQSGAIPQVHMDLHELMLKQTLRANKGGQNKEKTFPAIEQGRPRIQINTSCANMNERLDNDAKRMVCYHKWQQDEPNIRRITTHIGQRSAASWSTPKLNHQEPMDRTPQLKRSWPPTK